MSFIPEAPGLFRWTVLQSSAPTLKFKSSGLFKNDMQVFWIRVESKFDGWPPEPELTNPGRKRLVLNHRPCKYFLWKQCELTVWKEKQASSLKCARRGSGPEQRPALSASGHAHENLRGWKISSFYHLTASNEHIQCVTRSTCNDKTWSNVNKTSR